MPTSTPKLDRTGPHGARKRPPSTARALWRAACGQPSGSLRTTLLQGCPNPARRLPAGCLQVAPGLPQG
eukprot:10810196-Alexandrium_andersonii.AAC.1